ncbi:sulfatase-like hydrolase/transferase [Arthrobacter sp. zg-Y820]|uniref:sulfatase-like hydrolase/transferase n=1 Tax=unclassified Arthrobacter TaxID=235627 RepID=UPI001E5F1D88|nr:MULTISPECIES: sulfatase-like hydrolase/transferase [unclassified Arthrobacter]MCC9198269.1 sulfatase-like hydrolase/transferase [Arthrobacter sp. zg-Y820]MDK1281138.1 sulfatase-like hydrolase/transferase [Arthrobacter sp. zg.Y820]WIB09734.1 sulfatase-like hydrolase/transferase [Arthrobacter sp. zg-Y820]
MHGETRRTRGVAASGPVLRAARKAGVVLGRILLYVLIWAGLALLIAAAGIQFYWGEISVSQMMLNLVSVETEGGGGSVVWAGILGIGVAPVVITALIALWQFFRRRKRRKNRGEPRRPQWIRRTISAVLVSALVIGGVTAFSTTVGVADYIKAANSDYDLADYYVEPTVTDGEHKRNLVVIYLESGEATLGDDQLFEKDAFAPLKEATPASEGWQSTEGLQQFQGGGWTMAGVVSTQCGVPLKGTGPEPNDGSGEVGVGVSTYLGGATCLGDVLADHGYTSVFLGGANSAFAAKDIFLRGHGYSEQKGLADWRSAGEPEESFRSDWGLSDERLMAHAKDKIDLLHAEAEKTGQPFNLSLLTLDTHKPAHVFDYCNVDTQNTDISVFSCSMAQVAGFVNHMKEKGYLDDTAVVIMGDHLKQLSAGDAFHEQLDGHTSRSIFNRIWVPGRDKNSTLRSGLDQLNMFPTLLEAAGLTLEDHEAGLGVSAFAERVPGSSAQAMDPNDYLELLNSHSPKFYTKAWAGEDVR